MPGNGPPLVVRLLAEQRKRCLATILSAAESSGWWQQLTTAQQAQFRDQVRTAVAVFYDLTRDVLKVTEEEDGARNELTVELLRALHTHNQATTAGMRADKVDGRSG